MNKVFSFTAIGAIVSLGIAPVALASSPNSGENSNHTVSTHPTSSRSLLVKGFVGYWGYSTKTKKQWSSKPIRVIGGNPLSANNIRRAAELYSGQKGFAPVGSDSGANCALLVNDVYYVTGSPHGTLRGSTVATCTGSFDGQYTSQKFQRDSFLGWRDYSGIIAGKYTYETTDDDYWATTCNSGGDLGGRYNYRQYAFQTVFDSNSNPHIGPAYVSGGIIEKYGCGTGKG